MNCVMSPYSWPEALCCRETQTITQDDQNPSIKLEQSPGKQLGSVDRLKRDEWSEGAVTILLEAYESKWILRNRAKLKGQDWEDVAKCVSSRESNSKSPKTQTQCKNKIESMKKRYRSESATSDTSSWPLFSRLEQLLRGTGVSGHGSLSAQSPAVKPPLSHPPLPPPQVQVMELSTVAHPPPPPHQPPVVVVERYTQDVQDVEPLVKENDGMTEKENDGLVVKSSEQVSEKDIHDDNHLETDSSTPALYSNDKDGVRSKNKVPMTRKRRRRDSSSGWEEVAESIRWAADAVVRSEKAKMDTMMDIERMRVEAETKRGEMDLRRTEIIANTQLEIARLFASLSDKSVDSSLKIGRSDL